LAIAQVSSVTNAVRAVLPRGIQPPIAVRYSASSVPAIQLALASTPGTTMPTPSGGKQREIMVDLTLHTLRGLGLTPSDVFGALTAQNLTELSGRAKLGNIQ